ncbi:hypothetical protein EV12_0274 [Prochlorococcus sp. MIT 0701]|nr:hypothetical protein EV12_0274 [Prochlorococcus sp. MIT 0701]
MDWLDQTIKHVSPTRTHGSKQAKQVQYNIKVQGLLPHQAASL